MLFAKLGQVTSCAGGRVTRAEKQNLFPGIIRSALAQQVFKAIGDAWLGRQLAERRSAAVSHPAMLPIGAAAVQHNVRLFDALVAFNVADQEAKGLLSAPAVPCSV